MKKIISVSLLKLSLLGCAAALVPESNSPTDKINQAFSLFSEQNRPQAAVKLLGQALDLSRKNGDKVAEARAELYLGEIFRAPGPKGEDLRNKKKAAGSYQRAASLYQEIKFFKNQALALWSESGTYDVSSEKGKICETLNKSKAAYEKAGASEADVLAPSFSDGKLKDSIQSLISENNC